MPQLHDVVLLVEDEDSVRRALTRTLVGADLKVVGAPNGELALQELRGLGGSLGLLITDINMPGMNGFELARACRTILPAVPILFITGVGTRATAAQADRLGADLLLKPFGPDHFLEIVTRLIAQDSVADRSLA
jgi:DNA-binding response OmpR family regulator